MYGKLLLHNKYRVEINGFWITIYEDKTNRIIWQRHAASCAAPDHNTRDQWLDAWHAPLCELIGKLEKQILTTIDKS